MKGKKIAVVVSLVILAAVAGVAMLLLPNYLSGQKNYKLMKSYIEDAHGEDYEIVEKSLGSAGASGRNPDYLRVTQNGITYVVYAENGEITGDTYDENYEGKIVCDRVMEQVKNSGVTLPDFEERDIVISGRSEGNGGVWLIINIKDSTDYRSESWLYEVFCVLEKEYSDFGLLITAGEDVTNNGTVYSLDYQSGEKIENIEDFWVRFH